MLKSGSLEHIIYVTGKTTGQIPVLAHLETILPKNSGLNYLQLRSHEEVAIHAPLHSCIPPFDACSRAFLERFRESGLNEETLFKSGKLSIEEARALGEKHALCPHTLLLFALKWSNFWVCDYNYIFSSTQRSLLNHYGYWDPKKTLLIIDEAHNLPSRVENNLSGRANIQEAISIYDFMESIDAPTQTLRLWHAWIDHLSSIQPTDVLPDEKRRLLATTLQRAVQASVPSNPSKQPSNTVLRALDNAIHLSTLTKDTVNTYWTWSEKQASIQVDCLKASASISATLLPFHTCIFSSATLLPLEDLKEACRIDACSGAVIHGQAPWKDKAYTVAIDCRVDTRYRRRAQFYNETARTIARLERSLEGPIAVFFPSYRYAEIIHTHLCTLAPGVRVALQKQGETPTGQLHALENALQKSDILLLVLGSRFSEGIDFLGETVKSAVIVGPALPEVNARQQARLDGHLHLGREHAFYRTYIIPGMKKINQALGRLVRAPGQNAKVLLHCQRFAEPAFRNLLPPECKSASILRTEADLDDWLSY
jgi:Rad3-related DNA helicase